MSIVIDGAYGFGNVGDEAMLHIVISHLNIAHPGKKIIVSSVDQISVNKLHGVDTICGISPISVIKSLFFLRIQDFVKQLKAIFKMRILVYGGGSLFTDSKGLKNIVVILLTIIMARMIGSKVILWGVSIGPLNTMLGRIIAKVILKLVTVVIVRDERSIITAKKLDLNLYNIKLGVDLLFNILQWRNVPRNTRTDVKDPLQLGLSLRPFPAVRGINYANKDKMLVNSIVKVINNINVESVEISSLIFSEGGGRRDDIDMLSRVKEQFLDESFKNDIGGLSQEEGDNAESIIINMLSKMTTLDVVIGERFHSLVTSAIVGVPFIAISYDQKVKEMAVLCGLSEYCIDFEKDISEDELTLMIEMKLEHLLKNYLEVKEVLNNNVNKIAKVSEIDLNYINECQYISSNK